MSRTYTDTYLGLHIIHRNILIELEGLLQQFLQGNPPPPSPSLHCQNRIIIFQSLHGAITSTLSYNLQPSE